MSFPKSRNSSRWSDDCLWPRRLLHVRSMTSYPWQPGNRYGGHKEPWYNVISYTWGRFQYRSHEAGHATTRPLAVKGVPWPMPRVRPSHFTADQLHEVIETAACPQQGCHVDFVWLDVACIDQTKPHTAGYYSEVGRQATIFSGATAVVAWLTSFESTGMRLWWEKLESLEHQLTGAFVGRPLDVDSKLWDTIQGLTTPPVVDMDPWLKAVVMLFQQLRADPWCTSLWTLQEAFLCPSAIIILRDGRTIGSISQDPMRARYLRHLISRCSSLKWKLQGLRTSPQVTLSLQNLNAAESEIQSLGFLEGYNVATGHLRLTELGFDQNSAACMGNPLMLLRASHDRQCYEETDRIRGIMQVFGLRLGESAPNAIPGKTYSLSELENQFACEVLRRYPISSQLVIQHRSCQPRNAWRVSSSMRMTAAFNFFWRQILDPENSTAEEHALIVASGGAELAAVRFETSIMARFKGRYSSIRTFTRVVRECVGKHTLDVELEHEFEDEARSSMGSAGSCDLEIDGRLAWLNSQSRHRNMGVLFLARIRPPRGVVVPEGILADWGIGLILCQESGRQNVFRKVGVLIWNMEGFKEEAKNGKLAGSTEQVPDTWHYLNHCSGAGWLPLEAYFG